MFVPSIFIVATGFMDCTRTVTAVTLLTIGISITGFQYGSGYLINPGDIAPKCAGIIFGISNTFATVPGFLAPTVIGYITVDVGIIRTRARLFKTLDKLFTE